MASKELSASDTVLVGLISGEDGSQYGAVLTAGDECIAFETDANGMLRRWEIIEDPDVLNDAFQAVGVGIAMKRDGEIS